MKMKKFGLPETKLFHFNRMIKNGLQGLPETKLFHFNRMIKNGVQGGY